MRAVTVGATKSENAEPWFGSQAQKRKRGKRIHHGDTISLPHEGSNRSSRKHPQASFRIWNGSCANIGKKLDTSGWAKKGEQPSVGQ